MTKTQDNIYEARNIPFSGHESSLLTEMTSKPVTHKLCMRCFANGFPVSETLKFLNRYNFKIKCLNNPTNVFRSLFNIIF